jgi:signal transduction histidine kinase
VERLVHPDDRRELQEKISAATKNGLPYGAAFRAALPGGGIRYIAANGTVIRDSEGRPVRAIGVNRDRTEQVQAESERRRLQEERQHSEKLESLGSLAGGVAHDMNNVLAAIMGLTSALRSTCPDEDPRAKSLESILHASHRGRELVKALTDFARKGLEEPRQLDLNKTLREEVELLLHAKSPEVQVVLDLDPSLPPILGDAPALGSAIINLAINALDAMPGGGTLSFRSRSLAAGRIELVVADTGHGMTPEVLARAMEPFFTTKPVGKGTGLGLARVYGTVKAHGGSVEIRSQPGQGTSVRMVFPATGIPAQSLEPWAETPPARLRRPLDVLLVDDDDLIRSSTQALLEVLGHQSNTASSGEEGLAKLEAGYLPDVVILDMNMPGLGGAETLLRLRVLRPTLPVLLATGLADQIVLDLIKVFPNVTLLAKPFTLKELQKHLESTGVG